MKFEIKQVANLIFIVAEGDIVFKAWDESEFTERKLKNAIAKIQKCYPGEGRCEFVNLLDPRTFWPVVTVEMRTGEAKSELKAPEKHMERPKNKALCDAAYTIYLEYFGSAEAAQNYANKMNLKGSAKND